MGRVAVIGGGAFGTAMACVLRRSGQEVVLWAREPEVVAAINAGRVNPVFLPGTALVPGIAATNDLAAAATGRDFLLMVVPAQLLGLFKALRQRESTPALPARPCCRDCPCPR